MALKLLLEPLAVALLVLALMAAHSLQLDKPTSMTPVVGSPYILVDSVMEHPRQVDIRTMPWVLVAAVAGTAAAASQIMVIQRMAQVVLVILAI